MNKQIKSLKRPTVLVTMRSEETTQGVQVSSIENAWFGFLNEIFLSKVQVLLIPNFDLAAVEFLSILSKPKLVILPGGNDLACLPKATKSDVLRDEIENLVLEKFPTTPLLGVCRGFQLANVTLGGNTRIVSNHVATTHKVELVNQDQVGSLVTNSFHKWGIGNSDLAPELNPLAIHPDSTVEAARHKSKPWIFTMWHPERADYKDPQREWVIHKLRKLVC